MSDGQSHTFNLPQGYVRGFPGGSNGKESSCYVRDPGLIFPGLGRSCEEVNDYSLQYSCLENSIERGAWRATVHGVVELNTTEQHTHIYIEVQVQFSSVQLLSRVRLFATPWTAARQASLSINNPWSSPKLMSIKSVIPSNHLILCRPHLLLPSIFSSIRVFSNESDLLIRWSKLEFQLQHQSFQWTPRTDVL